MQTLEGKPIIEYPTLWEYRVIGRNKAELEARIAQVIKQDFTFKEGQSSSGGKFVSVIVSVQVKDQKERDSIFRALQESNEVMMVL